MNRIINDPNFVVEDMLNGFVKAHKNFIEVTSNPKVLKYKKAPIAGKVGIVKPANEIAKQMLDIILPDLPFTSGDDVVVLLSGLGATPVMEQYIVYNEVEELLEKNNIHVYRSYVGNYFTSLEMMGITLTIMKVDAELKELIDIPVDTVGLKQF